VWSDLALLKNMVTGPTSGSTPWRSGWLLVAKWPRIGICLALCSSRMIV